MFTFHHISLSVINLEESINFYSCLGFKPVFFWESEDKKNKIVHLKIQDVFLELFYFFHHTFVKDKNDFKEDLMTVGIKHFALKVESIEKAKQQFLERGFSISSDVTIGKTGIKYFFIKDPNDISLEIVEDHRIFQR